MIFFQFLQNLGHDGDDECETGLKEDREAYLTERAAKKKAQKRAYSLEYRKRPEVVARRKASEAERAVKKKAKNEAEIVGKTTATNSPTEGLGSSSLAARGREEPLSARSHMGAFAGIGNGAASTARFPWASEYIQLSKHRFVLT